MNELKGSVMPAWNPKANDIFLSALEVVAPTERQAFIERACGGDGELLAQVESLVAASQKAGSFLESPPAAVAFATLDEPPSERPGTQIGPYKLLQQIGEGGMGVVYMAEQTEPVKRRVALKIIKPGMDTRQVIARFEAERQALSLMDHPNIAKVLDAGTTASGRPYFVMELVKGQPITQYCDEHHLTPRQRLELLLPVCQAIQHAHQKGIIHRDIKPTNILVAEYDQQPVPKVIDFGVAKATSQALTEKTMFTGYGQIVGTLEYMSPEQAKVNQLDIDTRSDIYSLGVLLYELLTGSTPFDRKRLRSAAFDEMLRIIREEEPPKPSTRLSDLSSPPRGPLAPREDAGSRSEPATLASIAAQRQTEPAKLTKLVRGELDWIVMKALEKDRSRRYETANGLAADIQHYLSDEPVVACPPSAAYRFRKFARRNRTALMTASLVAAALVIGTVVSAWQAVRATRAEGLAKVEAERANREAHRANSEATRASDEATKAKTEAATAEAVNEYLIEDLLAQAHPENEPDRDIKLRTVVDRAAATVEGRFPDQPLVEAAIHRVVGNTYLSLREMEKAEQHFRRAFEIRRQVLGAEHHLTGASQDALGLTILMAGRPAEAEPILAEALRILTQTLGPSDHETLNTQAFLAQAMSAQGRHAEADKLIHDVYESRKRLFGKEATETLKVLRRIAGQKAQQGQHKEAEEQLREVLAGFRRVLRPEHPQTLTTMNQLARVIEQQGRGAEAEKLFREVLDAQRHVLGPEHPATVASLKGLGHTITVQSRQTDTLLLFAELYETQRRVLGPAHADTLQSMNRLAQEMARSGLRQKQEQLLRDAIEEIAKLTEGNPDAAAYRVPLADTQIRLGELLAVQKRPVEAEEVFRRAISSLEKQAAAFPAERSHRSKIANTYNRLAQALRSGRPADAEKAHRQAIAIFEKLAFDSPGGEVVGEGLGHTYRSLANSLDLTKAPEREQLYRQAAAEFEKLLNADAASPRAGDRRFMLADSHRSLADALLAQEKTAEAETFYQQALDQFALVTAEALTGPMSDLAWRREVLSLAFQNATNLLVAAGRTQDAAKVCQRAIDLFTKLAAERPKAAYFRVELAMRQAELARLNGGSNWNAVQHFKELYETQRRDSGPAHVETLRSMDLLGEEMIRHGLHREREMLLRDAIGDFGSLIKSDPDNRAYRVRLTDFEIRLGELLAFQQRPAEAEQTYRQVISALEKLAADFPADPSHRSRIASTYNRLGHAICGTRPAEAEKAHRQAIAILEKLAAEYPGGEVVGEGLGHAYGLLAGSLDQTTKASEREQLWRQAATQFDEVLKREPASPRSPHRRLFLAATYQTLADALLAQKKTAEAETDYRRAIDQFALVTAEALGRSEIDSAWRMEVLSRAHKNLMNLLAAAGRIQEAAEVGQKAVDLFTKLAAERPDEPYFREELAKRQAELEKLKTNP
jgi:eukaryotic-like serine/threonine-protein kinase